MFAAAFSANFANASAVPGFATASFTGRGIAEALLFDTIFSLVITDVVAIVLFAAEPVFGAEVLPVFFDILFSVTDALVIADVFVTALFVAELVFGAGAAEYPQYV